MPRNLCLIRPCLGLTTRIECVVRPLAERTDSGPCFAPPACPAPQPSAIKAQGPFHGPLVAEGVLQAIADCLAQQGYIEAVDPPIWRLHLQGELRRLNGERRPHVGDYLFRPES